MKIYLIGVGMGNPDTLTLAARKAIDACPVLIGAPRLLTVSPEAAGSSPGRSASAPGPSDPSAPDSPAGS